MNKVPPNLLECIFLRTQLYVSEVTPRSEVAVSKSWSTFNSSRVFRSEPDISCRPPQHREVVPQSRQQQLATPLLSFAQQGETKMALICRSLTTVSCQSTFPWFPWLSSCTFCTTNYSHTFYAKLSFYYRFLGLHKFLNFAYVYYMCIYNDITHNINTLIICNV